MRRGYLGALAGLLVLAGLPLLAMPAAADGHGHGDDAHTGGAEEQVGALTIAGAFARASVVATGAAYFTVSNTGTEDDRLVAASTPLAEQAQLHQMAMESGVMRMSELEHGIPVPAAGSAALAPGGMHVMLLGLTGPLVEGESLPLTLQFEHAGEITLAVPIVAPGATSGEGHADH